MQALAGKATLASLAELLEEVPTTLPTSDSDEDEEDAGHKEADQEADRAPAAPAAQAEQPPAQSGPAVSEADQALADALRERLAAARDWEAAAAALMGQAEPSSAPTLPTLQQLEVWALLKLQLAAGSMALCHVHSASHHAAWSVKAQVRRCCCFQPYAACSLMM